MTSLLNFLSCIGPRYLLPFHSGNHEAPAEMPQGLSPIGPERLGLPGYGRFARGSPQRLSAMSRSRGCITSFERRMRSPEIKHACRNGQNVGFLSLYAQRLGGF